MKRNHVKRLLQSNKGASLVLVMLMMVVLLVFGLAALTTSLSSLRLGGKAAEWQQSYYAMEEKAEKSVAAIDTALNKARAKAADYVPEMKKARMALREGSVTLYDRIMNETDVSHARRAAFMLFAAQQLDKIDIDYKKNDMNAEYIMDNYECIETNPKIRFFVPQNGEDEKGLFVTLEISVLGQADETPASKGRYRITEWREYKAPFTYDNMTEW